MDRTISISQPHLNVACPMFGIPEKLVIRNIIVVLTFAALVFYSCALAQSPPTPDPLPARLQIDGNGVDLSDGSFHVATPSVSVGQVSAGGLEFFMGYSGDGWRSNHIGSVSIASSIYTVSLGSTSEDFSNSSGTFTSTRGSGATLSFNSTDRIYTYTKSDGTVAKFRKTLTVGYSIVDAVPAGSEAYLYEIISPDGVITEISNNVTIVDLDEGLPPDVLHRLGYYRRVQSVKNNLGYQLHFEYFTETGAQFSGWHRVKKVTAINLSVDHCALQPGACTGLTKTWPSLIFTYHSSGNIASVKDALNRTTEYNYNGSDELTGIEWPSSSSNNITIGYNGAGRVSSVNRGFGTWTYTYTDGSTDRTTTVTNPASETTTVVSQLSTGLITSVKNGLNRTTTYGYDTKERLTSVTRPEGDKTTYMYDSRGNVKEVRSIAKPGSGLADMVTSATYPTTCPNPITCNKPTSATDARGRVTNYTYNSTHGGVTSVKQPSVGGVRPESRYTYVTKQARYKDSPSSYITGGPVYVLTVTSACATQSSCTSGADETKTTVAYPSSSTPNNLLPLSTTTAAGNGAVSSTSSFTYDHNGDVRTVDGLLSGTADRTRFLYNRMRQQTAIIGPDPDGGGVLKFRAVKTDYNTDGLPTIVQAGTVTNQSASALSTFIPLQKQETLYDSYNRVKETRVYEGGTIKLVSQMSYDSAGRVECSARRLNPSVFGSLPSSACSLGSAGSFGSDRISKTIYDAAGQPINSIAAFGTSLAQDTVRTTYTDNGLVKTVTDARGYKTTYDYDGFDRLIKTRFPSKTAPNLSSTTDYDSTAYHNSGAKKGLVSQIRRRNGSVYTFVYDALDRVASVNAPVGDSNTSYTYDNFNRIKTISRASQTLTYTYDQLSRLLSEAQPVGGTVSYQYDVAGRRTRMTWPDGFYVSYNYDVSGAVTKIRENGSSDLATFTYDDLGRRTTLTRGNGFTTVYGFDGLSRLTSLTHNLAGSADDQAYGFSHNPASQITQRTDTNASWGWTPTQFGTDNYTVNGLNQYLTAAGSSPTYDNNGNLTGYNGDSYTYDASNRLKTAKAASNTTVNITYDPTGRLHKTAGTTGTRFLYDGAAMIAEYNDAGAVTNRYVHGPGVDEPLVWYAGSGTGSKKWLGSDPRGSIAAVTDGAGAATQINTYAPYGTPGGSNLGRFQFTGQMAITDDGLSLYYYRARFYDPTLGRFLQTDPIGYGDGMNMYAYTGNDPVNFTDPTGLDRGWDGSNNRPIEGGIIMDGGDEIVVTATRNDPGERSLDFAFNLNLGLFLNGPGAGGGVSSETGPTSRVCTQSGSRILKCVTVSGDLTRAQADSLGQDFHNFILSNSGADLSSFGVSVIGNASASQIAFVSAVAQFVGQAMVNQGGVFATAWSEIGHIRASTRNLSFFASAPSSISRLSTGEIELHITGRTLGGFFGNPYSDGSGLARAIIHETLHLAPTFSNPISIPQHQNLDLVARTALGHMGLAVVAVRRVMDFLGVKMKRRWFSVTLAIVCLSGCSRFQNDSYDFVLCAENKGRYWDAGIDYVNNRGRWSDVEGPIEECGDTGAPCIKFPILISVPPQLPNDINDTVEWTNANAQFSIQRDLKNGDERYTIRTQNDEYTYLYRYHYQQGVVGMAMKDGTDVSYNWKTCKGKLTFSDINKIVSEPSNVQDREE